MGPSPASPGRPPGAGDICDRDFAALLAGKVPSGDSCHALPPLSALPGLVPRVLADDADHALAPYDLAVLATDLDGWSHFHVVARLLLEAVRDPAARQVVRRELDLHAVAGQD